jgi:hypothetical protein
MLAQLAPGVVQRLVERAAVGAQPLGERNSSGAATASSAVASLPARPNGSSSPPPTTLLKLWRAGLAGAETAPLKPLALAS